MGRRPNFTARQQRETIKRRDAGEPVREIALSPLILAMPPRCARIATPGAAGTKKAIRRLVETARAAIAGSDPRKRAALTARG